MPNRGSRSTSGPWGRLKPVELDPLESMGLPSKGDTRLLDFKTQERYYTKIVERYMSFCSDAGERDELLRRFASLELRDPSPAAAAATAAAAASPSQQNARQQPFPRQVPRQSTAADTKALTDVMAALRKLREGLVASSRVDDFAVQAYLFAIRLGVLVKHPESYHPALLRVLGRMRAASSLTSAELREVAGYAVLDAACRRGRLDEAYVLRRRYGLRDARVDAALSALVRDDYAAFWRVKRSVDGHKARLLEYAEDEMRVHALKCLGRAYLGVDLDFLERTTGSSWARLTQEDGVGWELDGKRVIIRKVKAR